MSILEIEKVKNNRIKIYFSIIANIYPIFAVIFFDWKIFQILFVYFSETILFLYLSLIKVYLMKVSIMKKIGETFIYIFIFGIFYGFTGIVILLFYFAEVEKTVPDAEVYEIIKLMFNQSYFIGLIFFAGRYLYEIFDYIKKKEFLDESVEEVSRVPMIRVWILLMIVLGGVFLFRSTSVYLLIGFMILKTWIDVVIVKKETNKN